MTKKILMGFFSVVLAVSIFLCDSVQALAADELGKFDGSMSFTTYGGSAVSATSSSAFVTDSGQTYYINSGSGVVNLGYFNLELQEGHIYTGSLRVSVPVTVSTVSPNWAYISFNSSAFSATGVYTVCSPSAVSFGTVANPSETITISVEIFFNNYTVSSTSNLSFPVYLGVDFTGYTSSPTTQRYLNVSTPAGVSSVIDNDLYDDIITQDGSSVQDGQYQQMQQADQLHQEQMAQNESIAAAQESQAAAQHEELLNGYENSEADSNQAALDDAYNQYNDANSQVEDHEQAANNLADTAFNYDSFSGYATALSSVSGFYTILWNAFGDFNVIFMACLIIGVAGLFIGLMKYK